MRQLHLRYTQSQSHFHSSLFEQQECYVFKSKSRQHENYKCGGTRHAQYTIGMYLSYTDNMNRHNTNSTLMSPDKIGSANHKYTFNQFKAAATWVCMWKHRLWHTAPIFPHNDG